MFFVPPPPLNGCYLRGCRLPFFLFFLGRCTDCCVFFPEVVLTRRAEVVCIFVCHAFPALGPLYACHHPSKVGLLASLGFDEAKFLPLVNWSESFFSTRCASFVPDGLLAVS